MARIKRKWDLLSDEKRKDIIGRIQFFFKNERDEEIGMIAAEDILDCILEEAAIDIYQKGINDAKKLLKDRFEGFEIDLDLLIDQ